MVARRRHGHADRRPLSSRARRSRRGGWDLRSAPLTPRPRHRPPTCFSGAPYCHRDAGGTTSSPPWEDALLFPCSPLSEGRAQPDQASVCSREQREYEAPRRVTGLPGEWGLRENFGGPRVRVGCTHVRRRRKVQNVNSAAHEMCFTLPHAYKGVRLRVSARLHTHRCTLSYRAR